MTAGRWRFLAGIDVGGTFTDFVIFNLDQKRTESFKLPTTAPNPSAGIVQGLVRVMQAGGVPEGVVHGTTTITNTLVQRLPAQVALVTTRGFRDVLEIGRQNRRQLYDWTEYGGQQPLVPRRQRLEVTERVDGGGQVLTPLAAADLETVLAELERLQPEAVAVSLLHSYANAAHEQAIRDRIIGRFPYVCISSEINAEFREFERTSTTAVNAYVMPVAARYMDGLQADLDAARVGCDVRIIQSNGGMMSLAAGKARPVSMIMSGPAAGVAAAQYVLRQVEQPDAVTLDMGGTTTDVCLIHKGEAAVTADRRIEDQVVRLRSVAVESIGAGGGSIAWVDDLGALKVGPHSAGSFPGPACYGRGGTQPTVTDANLLLGYLPEDAVLGGSIHLDRMAAAAALEPLARRFNLTVLETAAGIVEIANAMMARAVRLVSVQRGYDLRHFHLIAFGGAGPVHAGRLAQTLNMPRVLVPVHSSAFSAFGCLVSDVRYDQVQTFRAPLAALSPNDLLERLQALAEPGIRQLQADGYPEAEIEVRPSVDLRYVGQNYELEVTVPAFPGADLLETLADRFGEKHRQTYSFRTADPVEVVNLRAAVLVPTRRRLLTPLPAGEAGARSIASHPAYFPQLGTVALPQYDRLALAPGAAVAGPAMVREALSTIIVYPEQTLKVDNYGNLWIE